MRRGRATKAGPTVHQMTLLMSRRGHPELGLPSRAPATRPTARRQPLWEVLALRPNQRCAAVNMRTRAFRPIGVRIVRTR
jgi:hypothetical protein